MQPLTTTHNNPKRPTTTHNHSTLCRNAYLLFRAIISRIYADIIFSSSCMFCHVNNKLTCNAIARIFAINPIYKWSKFQHDWEQTNTKTDKNEMSLPLYFPIILSCGTMIRHLTLTVFASVAKNELLNSQLTMVTMTI